MLAATVQRAQNLMHSFQIRLVEIGHNKGDSENCGYITSCTFGYCTETLTFNMIYEALCFLPITSLNSDAVKTQ